MMIVFTDTSYPELTYSLNASSTYFIISDCNNPSFVGDGYCDDDTNNNDCEFDKGDCCGSLILTQYCHFCECIQYSTPSWTTTANIGNFHQLIVAIKADSHLPTFQQIKMHSPNFPALASPSYEGSEPSQAGLGHFNFQADTELKFF